MPAELQLLPRKAFELTLSDGKKVQGQFGTWAISRFGIKKKLGLEKIMEVFGEEVQVQDMIDFILCAIEYKERQNPGPDVMNDIKLCQWIDDYSYESGETGVLNILFAHAGSEDKKEEEKKTETSLAGVNSSELQPVPA